MTNALRLLLDYVDTPIGKFALIADEDGRLHAAGWVDGHARMERQLRAHSGERSVSLTPTSNPGGLSAAVHAYFAGDLSAIDRLPVAAGGTDFQRAVWRALRGIPCGETRSYAELARQIGHPAAVRAVGLANGANPVGVVVPCHRVIGSNGSLTGYGGGIARKRWLLAHERRAGANPELPLNPSRQRI
jgi:methylated-DNA-[protein]-cysteine S-methyltransferase